MVEAAPRHRFPIAGYREDAAGSIHYANHKFAAIYRHNWTST